jgi:pimeloyl-ACP methyl ester carboxylesterase
MARLGAPYLLLAALCFTAAASAALDQTSCRLQAPGLPAAFAQCETLTVPARHDEPEGPTFDLSVARVPALSADPAPDPLVLIAGGPGGSAIDMYLQMRPAFEPVRRERDIILLDQRGTGRSAGDFDCALPEGLELEMAGFELLERVISDCLAEFESDPSVLTTSMAVRDLERLRLALGVETWNVYGVSYGTRVAQHYLRRYPDAVRAAILDGTVPAALALGPDVAPNAQTALDSIWRRCAAEPSCAAAFGDLPQRFSELHTRLAANPVAVDLPDPLTGEASEVDFGIDELRAVVRLMSYTAPTVAVLPLVVSEAARGNYGPLAGQAQIVVQGLGEQLSFAMHNSVVCAEDVPFYATDAGRDNDAAYLGDSVQGALEVICAHWPRGPVDDDFKSPLVSDTPILLLSGEHDPVTPPTYADAAIAAGLSNATHIVGRGQGHGLAGVGCMPRLLRSFLNEPDPESLDAECLADEAPTPFFVDFQGPAP